MATQAQRERIVRMLESGEYDSPDRLAAALLKECALILGESPSWVALTRLPVKGHPFPFEIWGPFVDLTHGKQLMRLYGGAVAFMKASGTKALVERSQASEPETTDKVCPECGHAEYAHMNGSVRYDGCRVVGCRCKATFGIYKRKGQR